MNIEEYIEEIGLDFIGEYSDTDTYVIQLTNSSDYGKVFSILEKSDDLNIIQDNQVVTEEGSSLIYESLSEPYILNLLADFTNKIYQLVINELNIEEN